LSDRRWQYWEVGTQDFHGSHVIDQSSNEKAKLELGVALYGLSLHIHSSTLRSAVAGGNVVLSPPRHIKQPSVRMNVTWSKFADSIRPT
jgi:hypothetical protein